MRDTGLLTLVGERALLGRDLKPEEARRVTEMVRRIAALVLMQPELDVQLRACEGFGSFLTRTLYQVETRHMRRLMSLDVPFVGTVRQ